MRKTHVVSEIIDLSTHMKGMTLVGASRFVGEDADPANRRA
jgi:hypothetical protein